MPINRGTILGYVHVLRDIREEQKFYELQSRLASIVENSDDAIISLSLDGTITSWNNAAARMFGYSYPDVVGKKFHNPDAGFPARYLSGSPGENENRRSSRFLRHPAQTKGRFDPARVDS